ncbi:MAG: hypothetical protein HY647_03070, partial [Acidobacteria bacterium]|nr:hypothetical protein [Acidobacteriota bacterium]
MAASKLRPIYLFVAFLVVLVLVIAYRQWQRSIVPVPTARAERRDIHTGVITNGRAEPIQFRNVSGEIEGEIEEVFLREGESVRKGQKLLQLSQKQIRSELE